MSSKAYREANRELLAAKQRLYYAQNREKVKAYREANRRRILEKGRAYYLANRDAKAEENRARARAWQKANPGRARDRKLEWAKANRQQLNARVRKKYETNPQAFKQRAERWLATNREKKNARNRAYKDENREKVRADHRAYKKANPEKNRAQWQRRRARLVDACSPGVRPDEWSAICRAFIDPDGNVMCAYCGTSAATTIDHVVPIARSGRDEPRNVLPACRRCNCSKGAKLIGEWQRGRELLTAARYKRLVTFTAAYVGVVEKKAS